MLSGDVNRTPAGVDRPLERRKGSLRLLLLDEVGPTFFEVFLLPEEQIPEKLVLLVGEQERPREPPHGTALPSGGPFLYVSYRLSDVRVECVRGLGRSTGVIIARSRGVRIRTEARGRGRLRGGTESLSRDRFPSAAIAPVLVGIIGGPALGDAFESAAEEVYSRVTPP